MLNFDQCFEKPRDIQIIFAVRLHPDMHYWQDAGKEGKIFNANHIFGAIHENPIKIILKSFQKI
jgi:hypothetical protein